PDAIEESWPPIRQKLSTRQTFDSNLLLATIEREHVLAAERRRNSAKPDDAQTVAAPITVEFQQRVGLMEMAAIVHRQKRTLERYKRKLPAPAVKGGNGKPDEWLWDDVRPVLEQEFGMKLPEHFPASRFLAR
ncbi:MAG: hypothetical protein ACREHD_23285, partial [Pirellulales bacterium]